MPGACFRQRKRAKLSLDSYLCWRYLFSRPVTRQLSSAQMSLTSVFGMGTGGPSSQSTPTRMDELSLIFYFAALRGFLLFAALQPLDCIKSFPICQPIFRFLLPNQSPASRVLIWRRRSMTQVRKHSRMFSSNASCVRSW